MENYTEASRTIDCQSYLLDFGDYRRQESSGSYQYNSIASVGSEAVECFSISFLNSSEFPFPSIHSKNYEETLDTQFSVGCIYGGGSMLSSFDVCFDSSLGKH